MFVEKITQNDIYKFLGKTLFNPDSQLSVSNKDIFNNNDKMHITHNKDHIYMLWGNKIIRFYDYYINTTSVSFKNQNQVDIKKILNENWKDFMTEKFGNEYVRSYSELSKNEKTLFC